MIRLTIARQIEINLAALFYKDCRLHLRCKRKKKKKIQEKKTRRPMAREAKTVGDIGFCSPNKAREQR